MKSRTVICNDVAQAGGAPVVFGCVVLLVVTPEVVVVVVLASPVLVASGSPVVAEALPEPPVAVSVAEVLAVDEVDAASVPMLVTPFELVVGCEV